MKDTYTLYDTIPHDWVVEPDGQPEYLDDPAEEFGPAFNLVELFVDRHVAAGRSDHVALHQADDGSSYTYADLAGASARLAHVLRDLGVAPGDRVAVRSPNRPEAVIAYLATWRLGAIAVLTPPQARRDEIRFFIEDTLAKVVIVANKAPYVDELQACDPAGLRSVEHVVAFPDAEGTDYESWAELEKGRPDHFEHTERSPNALAVIWHTGGTTGIPKACYHTAGRLALAAQRSSAGYGISDAEVHMMPAPIGHAAGWLARIIYTLFPGTTFVELEDFANPEKVLRAMSDYRVTWFNALATTWAQMLPHYEREPDAYDLSALRRTDGPFITGNGKWLYDAWYKHGLRLLNPMGSTAFAAWFFIPPDGDAPPMCSWGPIDGYEARVVRPYESPLADVAQGEIGQLAIRGVSSLTYWNRPELQARDVREGWTVIDDLVRVDDEGLYWYMGRADMMIPTAGRQVAPIEIEQVLSGHPAVREVAVTGAPDPERGQVVMAWVVPDPKVEPDEALRTELQAFVKERISPYKHPRRLVFMRQLPHDPVGKIVVKTLAGWAQDGVMPEEAFDA